METIIQNGSGSAGDSQEEEGRIKPMSELKSLWEGMASRNDRAKKGPEEGPRKPQLVRGERARQTETAGKTSNSSPPATVTAATTTPPTSSVAMTTISLVAPSSSTPKVKCSVTTPGGVTANAQRSSATARSSMTMSAYPKTTQTISIATNAVSPKTTAVTSMTRPTSYMAAPSNSVTTPTGYMVTPSSSLTTSTSSVARTTSSTPASGLLGNDASSSNDDGFSSHTSSSSLPFAADRCIKVDGPNRSQILRLVDDGSDGARQTVTVERTEEELTKEMMEALKVSADPLKGVTNLDVVEERLDVELSNGLAQVKVTVHCERIVPNRMQSGQAYRKSSVTVTRTTEVDMLATPERRRIYEHVVERYGTPEAEASHTTALVPRNKLSTDDVYALYRIFVEVTGRSLSLSEDPGNQMMSNLSKSEVVGLELLSRQSLPLSLLRLGPLISPVSSFTQ